MVRRTAGAFEPTLTGRIVLTFLFLAFWGAWALRSNEVFFVVCAIGATLLLSGLVTYVATARLEVERDLPARVFAGEAFDVRLRIRNRSRWRPACGLSFRDTLQVGEAGETTLPVLPPGRTVEVAYVKRMHRRGVYTLAATLVSSRFPFGLFERRVLLESPAQLVVLPALGRLRRRAQRDLTVRAADPVAARHARDGEEEFHSLREYRAGDNPRHIHWRTSARVGTLVRRVMRQEAAHDLTVLLDTCVGGLDADLRQRNLERAVSCAATLLAHAAARGRRAAVHFAGGAARHSGSRAGLLPALEALAALEPGSVTPGSLVASAALGRTHACVLLSLAGDAPDAHEAAARRGLRLAVWDVSRPDFARYFGKR
jgi:uncharacterized protein (DUF58 family)